MELLYDENFAAPYLDDAYGHSALTVGPADG